MSVFDLTSRKCLITGAGGAIGKAIASALVAQNATVILADIDERSLVDLADRLRSDIGAAQVHHVVVDLAEKDAVARLYDQAQSAVGAVDIVVNNAGINRRQKLLDVDRGAYDRIMDLNLRVPFDLACEMVRRLNGARPGAIVNIGSLNVSVGLESVGVYGQSKAGLAQLTRVMAVEWAERNVRANCVCPGFIKTPLAEPVWADPKTSDWIYARLPIKRPGSPEDVANACAYLASDAASYVTGQCLYVDGGFTAGSPFPKGSLINQG